MNNKIFSIIFMLFSFLLIVFLFVFIIPPFNFLITLVLGIILFFIVLGIAAGLYDYLDNDNKSNRKSDSLKSKDLIAEKEGNNFNPKNTSYHTKKKHRRRYYRERIGKRFKQPNKVLIPKKEIKKKDIAADKQRSYYLGGVNNSGVDDEDD